MFEESFQHERERKQTKRGNKDNIENGRLKQTNKKYMTLSKGYEGDSRSI